MKLHLGMRGLVMLAFLCGPATAAPMLRLSTRYALTPSPAAATPCTSKVGEPGSGPAGSSGDRVGGDESAGRGLHVSARVSAVANPPLVRFQGGNSAEVTPSFAGLSFGETGLYQVIVAVPADMPKGSVYVWFDIPNWSSNSVQLGVQ
jgi:hypothetical protein